jgi:hypothetical protein
MPEIMDAPAVGAEVSSGAAETVETGAETVETPETSTGAVDNVDSPAEKDGLTETAAKSTKLNLLDVVKKQAEALKAINPALPAAMQKAAHELGRFYGEFPGGLKEAVALKATLSEYGGVEGLKEVAEANSDYARLEQQYEKGDPAFITGLADALPVSFSQIMPAGLEKWKQVDPEMYNHVQARVLVQTLDGANVSQTLERIWESLDENDQKQGPMKGAIASIWKLIDGFRQAGAKAPERKVNPQEEALTQREQQLVQREAKALLAPIATEGKQQIQSITDLEMNQSYQWDKTDASVREAVADRVRQEVINASGKDKTFSREFQRLQERGDAQGLSRHVKNFQERVTPGIVQRVAKLFAVKPKGAGIVAAKKPVVTATNGNGKQPDRGWERVSAQPKFADIDTAAMGRNYEDMILDGKAILKSGRKVVWA